MKVLSYVTCAALACAAPAFPASLTLERLSPRITGEQTIDIKAPQSEPSAGYFLSSIDGSITRRDPTTGQRVTVLSGVTDPAGLGRAYSMAFSPDFDTTGRVYVSYATQANTHVVAEYTWSGGSFDPNTKRTILTIQHDQRNQHLGADVEFGPDGYMYVTTGDGDQNTAANPIVSQDVTDRRGKVLRIDPTGDAFPADAANNYAIPPGNPDFGPTADPALYAMGLRNPFRATFDTATGRYFIADVGEAGFEEINVGIAGANYGWNAFEGLADFLGPGALSPQGTLTDPLLTYALPGGQAITGGLVYRGADPALAPLLGQYIFADFVGGQVFSIAADAPLGIAPSVTQYDLLADIGTLSEIVAFGTDGAGQLYASGLFGDVYRITGMTAAVPLPAGLWLLMAALSGLVWVRRGGKAPRTGSKLRDTIVRRA